MKKKKKKQKGIWVIGLKPVFRKSRIIESYRVYACASMCLYWTGITFYRTMHATAAYALYYTHFWCSVCVCVFVSSLSNALRRTTFVPASQNSMNIFPLSLSIRNFFDIFYFPLILFAKETWINAIILFDPFYLNESLLFFVSTREVAFLYLSSISFTWSMFLKNWDSYHG